jgi:uncharacterized membrane protein (UPF0127 family)
VPVSRVRVVLRGSRTLVGDLDVADTMWRRGVGLLGRDGLPAHSGLVIRPCLQIHTWFMRFPIDVVFLDGNLTVVRVVDGMGPFRTAFGGLRARSVLELPAGTAARIGLRPGDAVSMVPA